MREPKKAQKNSPSSSDCSLSNFASGPNIAPAAATPIASPVSTISGAIPSPSINQRAPRTPKQEPMQAECFPPLNGSSQVWMPASLSQTPQSSTPKLRRTDSLELPSPTGESVPLSTSSSHSPLQSQLPSHLLIPTSPLDHLKKDDPMEKMAQMTSSLGGGPLSNSQPANLLHGLRSPSSTLSPQIISSPHSPAAVGAGSGISRPSVITQQGSSAAARGLPIIGSPASSPRSNSINGIGPPPANNTNQGPQVPEQPYMQQQSAIFVFTTELANRAADAVQRGHFASIIDVHMQQSETQRYLSQIRRMPGAGGSGIKSGNMGSSQRPMWLTGQRMPANDGINGRKADTALPSRPQHAKVSTGSPGMISTISEMPTNVILRPTKADKLDKLRELREKMGVLEEDGNTSNCINTGMGTPPMPPPPYSMAGHPGHPLGQRAPIGPPAGVMAGGRQRRAEHPVAFFNGPDDLRLSSPEFNQLNAEQNVSNVMPVPSPQPIQYAASQLDVQEVVIQKQPNRNFMRPQHDVQYRMNMQPGMPGIRMGQGGIMGPVGMDGTGRGFLDENLMRMPGYPVAGIQQPQYAPATGQMTPGMGTNPNHVALTAKPTSMGTGHSLVRMRDACGMGSFDPAYRPLGPASAFPTAGLRHAGHSAHPQAVNNTYVNAHMTIEQVNIPNMPFEGQMGQYSNIHYNGPPDPHVGTAAYPGSMANNYEGSPQISIKPGAPNTIQYLPSRPLPPKQPRPPPNLDFLNPYTGGSHPGSGNPQTINMGNSPSRAEMTFSMPPGRIGGADPYVGMEMGNVGYGIGSANLISPNEEVLCSPSQSHQPLPVMNEQYAAQFQQFQEQLYAGNMAASSTRLSQAQVNIVQQPNQIAGASSG